MGMVIFGGANCLSWTGIKRSVRFSAQQSPVLTDKGRLWDINVAEEICAGKVKMNPNFQNFPFQSSALRFLSCCGNCCWLGEPELLPCSSKAFLHSCRSSAHTQTPKLKRDEEKYFCCLQCDFYLKAYQKLPSYPTNEFVQHS